MCVYIRPRGVINNYITVIIIVIDVLGFVERAALQINFIIITTTAQRRERVDDCVTHVVGNIIVLPANRRCTAVVTRRPRYHREKKTKKPLGIVLRHRFNSFSLFAGRRYEL